MAAQKPAAFDGQSTIFRGNLYVHIFEDGRVEFDIVRAERRDAAALVTACLLICLRLTKMIDENGNQK